MKTKTIKTDAELRSAVNSYPDDQPQCELIYKDGNVVGARVGRARFEMQSYSLAITREIDREEVQRYRVRVDHPNFASINRYFDTETEGRKFSAPYETMSDTTVTAGVVTVEVDAHGRVVAEVFDGVAAPLSPQGNDGDEIPF